MDGCSSVHALTFSVGACRRRHGIYVAQISFVSRCDIHADHTNLRELVYLIFLLLLATSLSSMILGCGEEITVTLSAMKDGINGC